MPPNVATTKCLVSSVSLSSLCLSVCLSLPLSLSLSLARALSVCTCVCLCPARICVTPTHSFALPRCLARSLCACLYGPTTHVSLAQQDDPNDQFTVRIPVKGDFRASGETVSAALHHEYAVRYLEKMGVTPTSKNILMIKQRLPLNSLQVETRAKGRPDDPTFLMLRPKVRHVGQSTKEERDLEHLFRVVERNNMDHTLPNLSELGETDEARRGRPADTNPFDQFRDKFLYPYNRSRSDMSPLPARKLPDRQQVQFISDTIVPPPPGEKWNLAEGDSPRAVTPSAAATPTSAFRRFPVLCLLSVPRGCAAC